MIVRKLYVLPIEYQKSISGIWTLPGLPDEFPLPE
jgi:hypothetical protein